MAGLTAQLDTIKAELQAARDKITSLHGACRVANAKMVAAELDKAHLHAEIAALKGLQVRPHLEFMQKESSSDMFGRHLRILHANALCGMISRGSKCLHAML